MRNIILNGIRHRNVRRFAIGLANLGVVLVATACTDILPDRYQLSAQALMSADTAICIAKTGAKKTCLDNSDTSVAAGDKSSPPVSAGTAKTSPALGMSASPADNLDAGRVNFRAVHILVQDSQQKCASFVNSLYVETASTNVALDALNTASSALGTAFAAKATKSAFSAASSIFGGVKTSIDTEFLNTLAISHVAQAIQSTYSSSLQKYNQYLNGISQANYADIDPYAERSAIESYHDQCSLAAAEGSIASSLPPVSGAAATPGSISFVYTVPASPVLANVTTDLVTKFNSDANFKAAGVVASSSTPGSISFQMKNAFPLTVTVGPAGATETSSVDNSKTPPILTIGGTFVAGDTITISGIPPAQATSPAASPKPAATVPAITPGKPPTALLGASVNTQ